MEENHPDIIIDRMNFTVEQRMRYVLPAVRKGYKIKYVLFSANYHTCLARVVDRKDHPTIKTGDYETAEKVLEMFFSKFEQPKAYEYNELEQL